MWKSCNDVLLHQNAKLCLVILLAQRLHHEIATTMYSIRDTFSPIIQSFFKPLDDCLLCPPHQKHHWLCLVWCIATSHATSKGSWQQVMSSYFPHATTSLTEDAPLAAVPTATTPSIPSIFKQVPIREYLTSTESETTNLTD